MPHTVLALTSGWTMNSAVLKKSNLCSHACISWTPAFSSLHLLKYWIIGMHHQSALDFILFLFVVLGPHRHCDTSQTTSPVLSLFNLARTIRTFSKATAWVLPAVKESSFFYNLIYAVVSQSVCLSLCLSVCLCVCVLHEYIYAFLHVGEYAYRGPNLLSGFFLLLALLLYTQKQNFSVKPRAPQTV